MIPAEKPTIFTASGLINSGPCVFYGFTIGTDGVNDPTIAIYNNTAGSGQKVIPSNSYDASLLGLNGATGMKVWCDMGLFITITCAGNVEVVPQYVPYYYDVALGCYLPDKTLRKL